MTDPTTPRWIVEGFAEYVANLGTGQPVPVAAAELRDEVAAGRTPSALPADTAFATTGDRLASVYEQAWLACRLIARARIAGAAGQVLPDRCRRCAARRRGGRHRTSRRDRPDALGLHHAVAFLPETELSMRRTLVVTNDFPPRQGGIQSYVHELARRQPAGSLVVYASDHEGSAEFDAAQPFPVVRHPTGLLLPTPPTRQRVKEVLREHGASAVWFGASAPLGLLAPALREAGAQRIVASTHGHEAAWAMLPGAAPGARPHRRVLRRHHLPHASTPARSSGTRSANTRAWCS